MIDALKGRPIAQVGILVDDLDEALRRYAQLWEGAGPWRVYTYGPDFIPDFRYRGAQATCSVRIALGSQTPHVELLQPLGDSPSVYDGFGPGLHHLGIFVPSHAEAVAELERAGYEAIQTGTGYGLDGDGGFAYWDTVSELGVIVETIEVPKRRREPELVWP